MGSSASCGGCCEPMSVKFVPPEKRTSRESRQLASQPSSSRLVAVDEHQQLHFATTVVASEPSRIAAEVPSTNITQSSSSASWEAGTADTALAGEVANPLCAPSESAAHVPPRPTAQLTTSIVECPFQRGERESRARRRNETAAVGTNLSGPTMTLAVSWMLDEASKETAPTPRGAVLRSDAAKPLAKLISGGSTAGEPPSSCTTVNHAAADGVADESRALPPDSQELDIASRPTSGTAAFASHGTVDDANSSSTMQPSTLWTTQPPGSPREESDVASRSVQRGEILE